jgi:L-alanine-DL-glutamate epimerase-like enolase superfamily enzyme
MAWEMCANHILPDQNGEIHVPQSPGLGIDVNTARIREFLVDVEINVKGKTLYRTPTI